MSNDICFHEMFYKLLAASPCRSGLTVALCSPSKKRSWQVPTVASRSVSVAPSAHPLVALSPLSILLLAAIGAKLIGPNGGLQVGKWTVHDLLLPDSYSYFLTPTPTPRLLLLLPDSYSSTTTPTRGLLFLLPDSYFRLLLPDSYSPIPTPRLLHPDSESFMYTTSKLLLQQLDPYNQPNK